ncbi:F-box/FBD/LRR-repeat protein At5g56420-like [Vicia villosa]|uniref:F-box/FBD/LRR-repeat protein At5g56420-like n=1 Tax=Vicia villosa TaxID=3911 RepID=UPI00273CC5C8|nr:F-box/FBD/LRR-repeat protein At5g56420-like [Vicia villosa]
MSQSEDTTTVDRISDLSNEILCHILSFLPIKQAFTTTLLSKRWAPLCYSLTVLSFNDHDCDTFDHFTLFHRFIDKLMLSPSVSNQFLKTFRLKFRSAIYYADGKSFHAWVEAAKRRRVEEFNLRMNNETLNPTIFTSRTLVVLKLEKVEVEAATLYVDLPSLKTLHLKFVRFENQNDIKRVLNACPNLQDLHTCYPSFIRREENNEDGEFKSLFLSKLVRAEVGSIDVPFNSICNVEYLRMIRAQEPSLEMNVEEIFKGIPVF